MHGPPTIQLLLIYLSGGLIDLFLAATTNRLSYCPQYTLLLLQRCCISISPTVLRVFLYYYDANSAEIVYIVTPQYSFSYTRMKIEHQHELYHRAAEQGHASAQYNLAVCYYNGTGVEKDEQKAVECYKKAAEQGVASAQYNLAVCYENGTGVEKDKQKAVEWYQKAAEQGDAKAQYNLDVCYRN